ncbi:MAG: hypothetical protein KME22_22050 [Hassallia sp. WJT32-NPBG1]|jgi:hypothetical protein|nr:hypothetical protein [Hassallia sp. WJT32-NPBG1]
MTNIIFRRALFPDYPEIIALHRKNLFSNLSELERQNGFLTVDFNDDSQLAAINEDVTVIVAVQENTVVGYVCATSQEYSQQIPLLKYMMSLYPETMFQGQPLSNYRFFWYGPVCVATAYRGTGVLQGLFQALLAQVATRYNAGVSFVAKDNPRSLRAHTQKLGMEMLRDFKFNGKSYFILGFTVPPLPYS